MCTHDEGREHRTSPCFRCLAEAEGRPATTLQSTHSSDDDAAMPLLWSDEGDDL